MRFTNSEWTAWAVNSARISRISRISRFRRLKHSLLAPLPRSPKNPYSNNSRCGKLSPTHSTPWRKMTAGFLTCLLSLGFLCVLLALLLECLKRLWQGDETESSPTYGNGSSTTQS